MHHWLAAMKERETKAHNLEMHRRPAKGREAKVVILANDVPEVGADKGLRARPLSDRHFASAIPKSMDRVAMDGVLKRCRSDKLHDVRRA